MQVLYQKLLVPFLICLVPTALEGAKSFDKPGRDCQAGKQKACAEIAKSAKSAKDRDERLAAVMVLTDQALLADIAKTDGDSNVRLGAVIRLTDQARLAEFAKASSDSDVRGAAVQRLTDPILLGDIVKTSSDSDVRRAAALKLTDIAKTSGDSDVRKLAVYRLSDLALLADIAKTDRVAAVRGAVVYRLVDIAETDRDSDARRAAGLRLADIAKTGDSSVRGLAQEKLSDLALKAASSVQMGQPELLLTEDFLRANPQILHAAIEKDQLATVRFLLTRGADPNGWDRMFEYSDSQWQPLHHAVQMGRVAIVDELLSKGADRNAKDSKDVLRMAVNNDNLLLVQLLLTRGANPNAVFLDETPLINASERGKAEIVKALLAKGADVHVNGRAGTAVQAAAANGHLELVNLLKSAGASDPFETHVGRILNARLRIVKKNLGTLGEKQESFFEFEVETTARSVYKFSLPVEKAKSLGVYRAPTETSGKVEIMSPYEAALTIPVGNGARGQFTWIPQGASEAVLVKFTPQR